MRLALFALFASLAACGSTVTPAGDGGSDVVTRDANVDAPASDRITMRRVPVHHRATADACPSDRPATSCDSGGSGPPSECTSSAMCTSGTNGRCVGNPHDGCRCNYDACTTDTQCTMGGPCACRVPGRGASGANVCMQGNCRVDADCEGGSGFCSPTLGSCGDFGGDVGFYCHTPADECIDDADCATGDAGFLGQRPYCRYQQEVGRWSCSNDGCAG